MTSEKNSNNFTTQYEKKVRTNYSELGERDKENFNIWGNAKCENRWLNIYNDEKFIKDIFTDSIIEEQSNKEKPLIVADFGGAEGTVINLVAKQLKNDGHKVSPLNLDINPKSLELMKKNSPSNRA